VLDGYPSDATTTTATTDEPVDYATYFSSTPTAFKMCGLGDVGNVLDCAFNAKFPDLRMVNCPATKIT
jgi:hypothetical protein